jgi:hypothetical protein
MVMARITAGVSPGGRDGRFRPTNDYFVHRWQEHPVRDTRAWGDDKKP